MRRNKDVFSRRVLTGIVVGNINFNQQFIVGDTGIRGYSFGEYGGYS
jgi:hypothetical protein